MAQAFSNYYFYLSIYDDVVNRRKIAKACSLSLPPSILSEYGVSMVLNFKL